MGLSFPHRRDHDHLPSRRPAREPGDPNGNTTAYAYDDLGRETARTTTAAGPVARAALTRTYNRAGQILSEDSQISRRSDERNDDLRLRPSRAPGQLPTGPANEEEVAEARRLGGLRRRREKTVSGAYDFTGLGSVDEIRRLLDIAAVDTLGLENGIARSRVLVQVALAAAKLLETGELEARVELLESAVGTKRPDPTADGGSALYDAA